MKTTPTRTSTLRLLAAVLSLGFATDLCASVVELDTGSLELGGALEADHVIIGSLATLAGNGTIIAPATIAGTLVPQGTLSFGSTLAFVSGATIVSRVTGNESLDILAVAGAVTGNATVSFVKTAGAIPLGQTLIAGGTSSVYDTITTASNAWQLAASGNNLLVTDLVGDTDSDGIKDYWAMQYFSTRSVDKDADGDKDGMSNKDEAIAGTDPTLKSSLLALNAVVVVSLGKFEVSWQSAAGRRYTLLKSASLTEEFTPVITGLAANPPENTYTDESAIGATAFYKIRVEE